MKVVKTLHSIMEQLREEETKDHEVEGQYVESAIKQKELRSKISSFPPLKIK